MNRSVALLSLVVVVSACAEMVQGPRVVHYTPDRFYIRHVPVVETWPPVTEFELAEVVCGRVARRPVLEEAYQFNPVDIRYATYRCVAEGELTDPLSTLR